MAACQAKGQHDAYGNGQCSPGALDTKEFRHDVDTWARRRRRLILPENWWCLTIFWGKGIKTDLLSTSTWLFYCTTANWWQQLHIRTSQLQSLTAKVTYFHFKKGGTKTSRNQTWQWEIPKQNGRLNRNIIELHGEICPASHVWGHRRVTNTSPNPNAEDITASAPDNIANFLKRGKPA